MATAMEKQQSKRGEITIAIIGLVGIFVTATFSNWEKLFPQQNIVHATFSGYRPTGNFETEFRYFFDVSGTRRAFEVIQRQLFMRAKVDLLSKNPNSAERIAKACDEADNEAINVDDVIREMLPLYQKHFTLAEIQELNKFYSTEVMQDMVKKMPLAAQDAVPIQMRILNDYLKIVDVASATP